MPDATPEEDEKIEARMLVIPRQAHGPNEPTLLLKLMETNVSWFEEKLKP